MDQDLRAGIAKYLKESGFLSEMEAASKFREPNWVREQALVYVDRDTKEGREVDVVGTRAASEEIAPGKFAWCYFHVVAEVKRAESPWVAFCTPHPPGVSGQMDEWENLAELVGPTRWRNHLAAPMSANSLKVESETWAYSVQEAYKKPSEKSRWWSAFVAACKAGEHVLERNSGRGVVNVDQSERLPCSCYFTFVQPVVVLDGLLLGTQLSGSNAVELVELEAVPFIFHYRSAAYARLMGYRVDLVRLDAFEKYLDRCWMRHRAIWHALRSLAKSGEVL